MGGGGGGYDFDTQFLSYISIVNISKVNISLIPLRNYNDECGLITMLSR